MRSIVNNGLMLVHNHIYGNSGEFVDQYLREAFGVSWQQIDHSFQNTNHLTTHEVLSLKNEGGLLRAVSTMHPLSLEQNSNLACFTLISDPIVRALQVFHRVAGDPNQPNHAIAKERGFSGYIEYALGGGYGGVVVQNYQTIHFSNISMRTLDIVCAKADKRAFEEAIRNLSKLSFIGLADRPICSMRKLQQVQCDVFPELKLESFLNYYDEIERQSNANIRDSIKAQLGDKLYLKLIEANRFDEELYDIVFKKYFELIDQYSRCEKKHRSLDVVDTFEKQVSPKLFFLHIPKTAGTTFSLHLRNQFNHKEICPAVYWPELLDIGREERDGYKLISGHFSDLGRAFLDGNPQLVTVLRDPIERVISLIFYQKHLANSEPQNLSNQAVSQMALAARNKYSVDIEEILGTNDFLVLQGVSNYQTRVLSGGYLESAYVLNDSHLEQAKKNLLRYKLVGLTEHMQESLNMLSYFMGWPPADNFFLNETPPTQTRSKLPQVILDKVRDLNDLDLRLYEFAKDLFFKQRATIPYPFTTKEGLSNFYHFYYKNYGPLQETCFSSLMDFGPVGASWWEWESRPNGGGCRWTGPGTYSFVDLPVIKSKPLAISFHVAGYASAEILSSAIISVDEIQLATEVVTKDSGGIYLQAIAEFELLNLDLPFLRVGIHLIATIPAKEINQADRNNRQLGLAIHALDVSPFKKGYVV